MSQSGSYKNLGASILDEQKAKADADSQRAQAQHQKRVEAGKRAKRWWSDQMVPELAQANPDH